MMHRMSLLLCWAGGRWSMMFTLSTHTHFPSANGSFMCVCSFCHLFKHLCTNAIVFYATKHLPGDIEVKRVARCVWYHAYRARTVEKKLVKCELLDAPGNSRIRSTNVGTFQMHAQVSRKSVCECASVRVSICVLSEYIK